MVYTAGDPPLLSQAIYISPRPLLTLTLILLPSTTGAFLDALPLYVRSLEIKKATYGPHHPEVSSSLNNIGLLFQTLGNLSAAQSVHEDAFFNQIDCLGRHHPDVATSLSNLAALATKRGELGDAKELYIEAIEVRKEALGSDHIDVAAAFNNLAGVLVKLGELNGAADLYEECLRVRLKLMGEYHPAVAEVHSNIGAMFLVEGRVLDAMPCFEVNCPLSHTPPSHPFPHPSFLYSRIYPSH